MAVSAPSAATGAWKVGSAANILAWTTSLEENLNKQPFLGKRGQYTVNSPVPGDPNLPLGSSA